MRAYRKALDGLLDYVKEQEHIPLGNVMFEHLSSGTILSYIDYLGTECGCSPATCNARFAAIRAFLDYASDRDITIVAVLNELRKAPFKKMENTSPVEYMSMEAVSAIVMQTDDSTQKGMRDRVFIMLMYDTGARVQEITGIRLCDIQLDGTPKATLHGKGNKIRTVPLMERTASHLKKYISVFHPDPVPAQDAPLFYSVIRGQRNNLTDRLVRYMLRKYGEKARVVCPEVPENIHPHMLRHSRAMHLYQEGMALELISQWLGHSHLKTTQIYAFADTEHKRKAIAAATPPDSPLYSKLNSPKYTLTDEEVLKKLTGLK